MERAREKIARSCSEEIEQAYQNASEPKSKSGRMKPKVDQTRVATTTLKKKSRYPISLMCSPSLPSPYFGNHKSKSNEGFERRERVTVMCIKCKEAPLHVLVEHKVDIPLLTNQARDKTHNQSSEEDKAEKSFILSLSYPPLKQILTLLN